MEVVLEGKMAFPISEENGLPTNAKSLVESVMASFCECNYPVNMVVKVSSQRILIGKTFLVPIVLIWHVCPITRTIY